MDDPIAAIQLVILILGTTIVSTCIFIVYQRVKGS